MWPPIKIEIMKLTKLAYAIVVIVALFGSSSCNKSPLGDIQQETQTPIGFSNIITKASLSDLQADGFGVWATTSSSVNSSAVILTNEKVYLEGTEWTYDNTRYWIDDTKFYFLAVHPYSKDNSPVEEHSITEEGVSYTVYTMDVTTPTTADYDPLVATNVTDTSVEGYATTVPLNFEHMMCKVNLKVIQDFDKTPDFDYYVSKVTISGVKGSGTYVRSPAEDIFTSFWLFDGATTRTFEKSFTTPVRLRNPDTADKKVVLTVFGEGLLLIPQQITTNAMRVRIDYYYDVDTSDDDMGEAHYVESFIPASNIWESNKAVTYVIALSDQKDITFATPTIEPWGSPQTGGTIIIK